MAGTPQPAGEAQGHKGDPKAQDSYLGAACAAVGGSVSPSLASPCTPRTHGQRLPETVLARARQAITHRNAILKGDGLSPGAPRVL